MKYFTKKKMKKYSRISHLMTWLVGWLVRYHLQTCTSLPDASKHGNTRLKVGS